VSASGAGRTSGGRARPTGSPLGRYPKRENLVTSRPAVEAVEEAIVNALVAAQTMVGRDGITAHALPHDRLVEVMDRYGRGPSGNSGAAAGV